jgi:hypothetical protein
VSGKAFSGAGTALAPEKQAIIRTSDSDFVCRKT